jgi:alpha-L-fucosidase 2
MNRITGITALVVTLTALLSPGDAMRKESAVNDTPSAMTLWYRQSAPQWDHALPIGNGRLGAMIFGHPARERIQFNEETLWSGRARDRNNPEALRYLPEVRRLLFAGQPKEAMALAEQKLMGAPSRLRPYQTFGDAWLTFEGHEDAEDYRRALDLDTAIARVRYRADGVNYPRDTLLMSEQV